MAIWYVDLENGNDSTGTGTNLLPYKTTNKALTVSSSGDEVRIAKNTTPDTTIVTTAVWTRNSLTMTMSGDHTATMVAKAYIGKPTAAGNGAFETFYRVSSSSYSAGTGLTTVTLTLKYIGDTETTSSVIKKFIMTDTGNSTYNTSATFSINTGGSYRSNFTMSGGWNLATQTRDGESWMKGNPGDINTTWYFIYSPGDGSTNINFSYMNIVETQYAVANVGAYTSTTITRCSFYQSAVFYGNLFHGSSTASYVSAFTTNNSSLLTQISSGMQTFNYIQTNSNGTHWFNYQQEMTFNGCKFASSTHVLYLWQSNRKVTFNDTIILGNKSTGIGIYMDGSSGAYYIFTGTSKIISCSKGFAFPSNGNGSSVYIEGLSVDDCVYGFYGYDQFWGSNINGFTATNCDYCYYIAGVYSGNNQVQNINWSNITNYGLYLTDLNDPIHLIGGSIALADVSKVAYNPSTIGTNLPRYTVNNVTNLTNGQYWNSWRWKEDTTNFRTTSPCFVFNCDSSVTKNYGYFKFWSLLATQGTRYRISCYIKASNASWSGELGMVLALNGNFILRTTITTLTTGWVKYDFDMPTAAEYTGELSIMANINNSNTYDVYFDDFSYEVL